MESETLSQMLSKKYDATKSVEITLGEDEVILAKQIFKDWLGGLTEDGQFSKNTIEAIIAKIDEL